jgi:uncharacterized protein
VPEQAAELAGSITTLTPLVSGPLSVGRHAYGALGLDLRGTPGEVAVALLRGFRQAKLQALSEVADLYAQDGWWRHPAPWQEEPVPVSELLAGAYGRVGLAAFEPGGVEQARQALRTLEHTAELTVSGKRLVAELQDDLQKATGLRNGLQEAAGRG